MDDRVAVAEGMPVDPVKKAVLKMQMAMERTSSPVGDVTKVGVSFMSQAIPKTCPTGGNHVPYFPILVLDVYSYFFLFCHKCWVGKGGMRMHGMIHTLCPRPAAEAEQK